MSRVVVLPSDNGYIDVHTHSHSRSGWRVAAHLLGKEELPEGYFSTGIHPWYIDAAWRERLSQLKELLKQDRCVALGEIGLDSLCAIPYEIQKELFALQLDLAEEHALPVVLHCVKSFTDVIAEVTQRTAVPAWIFHGFSGSREVVAQLNGYECYFSFGKDLVQGHQKRRDVFCAVPRSRILLETDEWPGTIEEVYAAAATILGIPLSELKESVWKNVYHALGSLM